MSPNTSEKASTFVDRMILSDKSVIKLKKTENDKEDIYMTEFEYQERIIRIIRKITSKGALEYIYKIVKFVYIHGIH